MTLLYCKDLIAIRRVQRLQMTILLPTVKETDFQGLNTLTVNENIVFRVLLVNHGLIVSRDQLMCALYSDEGPWPRSNGLQVFVARLRAKMRGQIAIVPVHGYGYRLELQS